MIVLCMSNAALLVTVGILGEYVGKIFEESKGRPLYIVADAWNVSPRSESHSSNRSPEYEHESAAPERR
jgi:dolichol-phosphate mannosyltransferase